MPPDGTSAAGDFAPEHEQAGRFKGYKRGFSVERVVPDHVSGLHAPHQPVRIKCGNVRGPAGGYDDGCFCGHGFPVAPGHRGLFPLNGIAHGSWSSKRQLSKLPVPRMFHTRSGWADMGIWGRATAEMIWFRTFIFFPFLIKYLVNHL